MQDDAGYVACEDGDDVGLVVGGFGEGTCFRGEEQELDDGADGKVQDRAAF